MKGLKGERNIIEKDFLGGKWGTRKERRRNKRTKERPSKERLQSGRKDKDEIWWAIGEGGAAPIMRTTWVNSPISKRE